MSIQIFRDYMSCVSRGLIDAPTCGRCQSVLLWYVDTTRVPYWRCTGCQRITFPGSLAVKEMEDAIREANNG